MMRPMFRLSSILMLLAGVAAIGYGIYGGLSALGSLYQGAMDAPLDQPEGTEKAVADVMLRSALIGVAGFVPLLLGAYFWRMDRVRARRRASGRE
jgi:hypothetical protein